MIGHLYKQYHGFLVNYANKLLGDFHLAEDAASETWGSAVKKKHVLEGLVLPQQRAWLFTTCHYHCLHFITAQRARSGYLASFVPIYSLSEDAEGMFGYDEKPDLYDWNAVKKALMALPERQRIPLLASAAGYTVAEISAMISVNPKTNGYGPYVSRGRAALRAALPEVVKALREW